MSPLKKTSVSGSYPDPDRENFIKFFRSGSGSKDPHIINI